MTINSVNTTAITKINGVALASIVKMNGVTLALPSPIPAGIVTDGLIMYLDAAVPQSYSGTGTNWTDITYDGNDGTLINGVAYSPANSGTLVFDGVNDYVDLTNRNLDSYTNFVWNAWVKTPSVLSGFKMILSVNTYYCYLSLYNNQFTFDTRLNGSNRFGTLLPETWYNVTVVRDTNVDYCYINGVLINSIADIYPPAGVFQVGVWAYNNTLFYDSNISVVSIYNQSLTAAQVLQNYNALVSRYSLPPSSLAILNADANTYNPSFPTTWIDNNGHVGSLVNGTSYSPTFGGNMVFDGINDYATFPNEVLLDSQTITMESWASLNTLFQQGFIFEKGLVNTQYSNFFYTDGNYYFRTQGLSNVDLSIPASSYMTTGAWYLLTCTYASGVKSIYVNGVLVNQLSGITGTIPSNNTGLYLGAYYGGGYTSFNLNGKIAISRAYNIALTATQVLQNFNTEKTRFGY
jgi:hypothetical protein